MVLVLVGHDVQLETVPSVLDVGQLLEHKSSKSHMSSSSHSHSHSLSHFTICVSVRYSAGLSHSAGLRRVTFKKSSTIIHKYEYLGFVKIIYYFLGFHRRVH